MLLDVDMRIQEDLDVQLEELFKSKPYEAIGCHKESKKCAMVLPSYETTDGNYF